MIIEGGQLDSLTIEEMTDRDIKEIMAIERVSFPTPWSENMFRKELRADISRNMVARLRTEKGDELVGYMNYWVFAGETHLNNIAVNPDYRRRGVASGLLHSMIRRSIEEGVKKGTLEVRRSNVSAIGLYEKFGYKARGVRPRYYDDTMEDALIMWCDFSKVIPGVREDADRQK